MQTLKPIRLSPFYFKQTRKEINEFFKRVIFDPLFEELRESNVQLSNASDPIGDALQTGKIYYDSGYIYGSFNAKISRGLRAAGAVYDRSKRGWHLPLSKIPEQLKLAILSSQANIADLQRRLIDRLDTIDVNDVFQQYEFEFDSVASAMDNDIDKTLKKITIPVTFTKDQREAIKAVWQENLKLYIKDWSDENILSMRKQILDNTTAGYRASQMERIIAKKYEVSQRKAEFLARQETSLLLGAIREERYGNAGIFKYKWSTSHDEKVRDRHRHLDGTIHTWDNPPIVDLATGRKAHPGNDFNCRCVPIPIIE